MDDVTFSVGDVIDPSEVAVNSSTMSFAALSVTLADAVTDVLSVIPPVVETMLRLVGSIVAPASWTTSPAAVKAAPPAIVSGPSSVIPPAVEMTVSAPALIEGRVKPFVEVRETAANGSPPPKASKLIVLAVTLRSQPTPQAELPLVSTVLPEMVPLGAVRATFV